MITIRKWVDSVSRGVAALPERQESNLAEFQTYCAADRVFFGCPVDFACDPPRSSFSGPYSIRRSINSDRLPADLGNIITFPDENNANFGARLSHMCWKNALLNKQMLWIGGDHSITYYAVSGILAALDEIVFVQLDAHNDLGVIGKNKSSRTLPSLSLNPINHANFAHKLALRPQVNTIFQIGVRSSEKAIVTDSSTAKVFQTSTADDVMAETNKVARQIASLGLPVYLSIDMDVIDPSVGIAVTTPLDGGLLLEQFFDVILCLLQSGADVVAIDIVEHYESDCAKTRQKTDLVLRQLFETIQGRWK